MLRSDLRALTRAMIPGAKVSVVNNPTLNLFIEQGILDIAAYTKCMNTNKTFDVEADTGEYTISTEIADFLVMDKPGIWWYDGTQWLRLRVSTLKHLDTNFVDWRNDPSDDPLRYSIDGNVLTFHPTPDTTLTDGFKIYYGQRPTKMTSDTHYPFTGSTVERSQLSIFDDAIMEFVKWKVSPIVNKKADENLARTEYNRVREEKYRLFKRRPDVSAQGNGLYSAGIAVTKYVGKKYHRSR